MLPSLYKSGDNASAWNVARAAACGGVIGIFAAVFRLFGPMHDAAGPAFFNARILEIAGAALAFAALCAGACALRNFLARHLIWPELDR